MVGNSLIQQQHHHQRLIDLLDSCFVEEFNTRLVKGDNGPIYLPVNDDTPYHRIVFAYGFFASTLHEISHRRVAGKACRERVDFGYWYYPNNRDVMIQSQFEGVKVKPQAYEWLFYVVAEFLFNVSCGNLEGDAEPGYIALQRRVYARVMTLLEQGILGRPARFIHISQHYYQTPALTAEHFPWPEDLRQSHTSRNKR